MGRMGAPPLGGTHLAVTPERRVTRLSGRVHIIGYYSHNLLEKESFDSRL